MRPHLERSEPSLLRNAEFRGVSGWELSGDAAYDPTLSRQLDGSGAVRLETPYGEGYNYGRLVSKPLRVEAGRLYSVAFFMRTERGPTYLAASVSLFDANGMWVRNLRGVAFGTTRDGVWEEGVLPVAVPTGIATIRVRFAKRHDTRPKGRVWIDDAYFGPGVAFDRAPSMKRAFSGTRVRVDALGNFEVRRGSNWEPFFPFCMYSDQERDWQLYSDQGWNVIMWTASLRHIQRARKATSEFNPNGMMAAFSISPYTAPFGWAYNDTGRLRRSLREIYEDEAEENLLMFYWDNERHHDEWAVPSHVYSIVDAIDSNANDVRGRPTYGLQGAYGTARSYLDPGWVDVSGTYVGNGDPDTASPGTEGWLVLDRLEGQRSPAAFAQFNGVEGAGEMRLRLYKALIAGARAVGYWRDGGPAGRVEDRAWWPDFPALRREVDALLPIIREPHWTKWTASVDAPQAVDIGTRDHAGRPHLFLVNSTPETRAVQVVLDGLAVDGGTVHDALTGETLGYVGNSTFSLTLPGLGVGSGSRVLRIERRIARAE